MMVRQASADARDTHTAIYPSPVSLQTPAPPPPHQAGYMMPSPGQNMPTPAFPAPHTATINQQQQQQQQSFIQQQVWDTICLNQSWTLTSINKCQHMSSVPIHTLEVFAFDHLSYTPYLLYSAQVCMKCLAVFMRFVWRSRYVTEVHVMSFLSQMPPCYCSPSQYPVSGQPYRPMGSVPYSGPQSQMPPAPAQPTGNYTLARALAANTLYITVLLLI